MAREQISELPLFPEQRACKHPTAARTLELFATLAPHRLYSNERHLKDFAPERTPLQAQVLNLLGLPAAAYNQ
jgi:hypothetical protein